MLAAGDHGAALGRDLAQRALADAEPEFGEVEFRVVREQLEQTWVAGIQEPEILFGDLDIVGFGIRTSHRKPPYALRSRRNETTRIWRRRRYAGDARPRD